jgi:hypothetical protein
LPQKKGARQRNKPPVNQHSKTHSKTGWLVGYRADLQNLRPSHTSLREELTKELLLKDRRKAGKTPNHLARLRQSFCLNTNTRAGC